MVRENYVRPRDALYTNFDEIRALFGLLYMEGILKSSHVNASDLWSNDGFAPELFRLVISINRFRFLLRVIRFDDINTREDRKRVDKLAPIRKAPDNL